MSKQIAWQHVTRAVVDARTGRHLAPEYAGQHYVFPRDVEKRTYVLRQNYLRGVPLTFRREEYVEDVLTCVFAYRGRGEYSESYTAATPEFPGLPLPAGQEIRCADDQLVIRAWVEPVTGEIVKLEESCRSGDFYHAKSNGRRLAAVARRAGLSSGDDVRERLNWIRRERARLVWLGRNAAWALLAAGALVLAAALARGGGGR